MLNDYLKTIPQYLVPKHGITHFLGLLAAVKNTRIKNHLIRSFVKKYNIAMHEAHEENPLNYPCFNDFFIRQLKPEQRPIAHADIVSPVDGIISELGEIKEGQILQAKGRYYTVNEFLACEEQLSDQFIAGRFATLYLSPKDYHRVHMPIKATLLNMIYIPGKLFSVQPATARVVPKLFARNERLVAFYDTEAGLMAMVLVGATIVGAIGTSWQGDLKRSKKHQYFNYSADQKVFNKGEEMGYFKLGSTVVLLFANGQQVSWLDELKAGDSIKFGQALGSINRT